MQDVCTCTGIAAAVLLLLIRVEDIPERGHWLFERERERERRGGVMLVVFAAVYLCD